MKERKHVLKTAAKQLQLEICNFRVITLMIFPTVNSSLHARGSKQLSWGLKPLLKITEKTSYEVTSPSFIIRIIQKSATVDVAQVTHLPCEPKYIVESKLQQEEMLKMQGNYK